jgi:hypothetical protein
MKFFFVIWVVVIMFFMLIFLSFTAFVLADSDSDSDWLIQKEHDLEVDFFATVDCDDPNAISGFIWNFSETKSQAEQCKIYQTASKLLQLFRVMDLNHTMLDVNKTMLPGNAYHSYGLKFPDDAYN